MTNVQEMRNWFAPAVAHGDRLPENGSLNDGTFFLLKREGIKILFLFTGGEKLQVASIPYITSVLPNPEAIPEHTRILHESGGETSEYILVKSKWVKIN